MTVDLRSDTVTRPTPEMRRAMAEAEVGDDLYGEDPTVNRLQDLFAELVDRPAALYVPSGTMANQLALRVQTSPGDAVVAGARSHVVLYEDGAGALNAGVSWSALPDGDGMLDPDGVDLALAGGVHHHSRVTLVAIEHTHMAAGGRLWDPARLAALGEVASRRGVPIHMDGAGLWHAAAATGRSPAEMAGPATTVMSCLSKGLGAPIGSLLAGPAAFIEAARFERHRMGGGWRQAGIVAAAGIVALEHMRERLVEDHQRARRLAGAVADRWPDADFDPGEVETNIVTFPHPDPEALLAHLESEGILGGSVAPGRVRLVTHLDVDDAALERACKALAAAPA